MAKHSQHNRRPHRTRRATWTAVHEDAVRALGQQYPRMGKLPLQVLLRRQQHESGRNVYQAFLDAVG